MKYLKLLSLTLIFSVLALSVAAQDAKADALLKASKNKFNSLKDLKANVAYTLTNPSLAKPVVKNGTIELSGRKFRLLFPDEEVYCDGLFMWMVRKKEKEVDKSDYDPKEGISVDKIYSIYEEKSKSRYDGAEGGLEKVSLFSTDEKGDFWKSEIWVSSSTKLIEKAILYGRNGTNYEYKMTNIVSNTGLVPTIFQFDEAKAKAAGYYINDLTE
jgi:outer membrane lipoprotein-sorting protein